MLTNITVRVPQGFGELFTENEQAFYVEAMKNVVVRHLDSAEKRLAELRTQMVAYETKYQLPYSDFSHHLPDSLEAHDDWMEWSYLIKITQKLRQRIEKLSFLTGVS